MNDELREALEGMRGRYRTGAIARTTTYYLSLGDRPEQKWTVTLTPQTCDATPGRQGQADCVLKMRAALFIKLVRGGYRPGPMDFISGRIRTSDLGLLLQLQQAFGV